MSSALPTRFRSTVLGHRRLSESGFELTIGRNGTSFRAGQLLNLHNDDVTLDRSYTIASGEKDDFFAVLYRLIPGTGLTRRLIDLNPGDSIEVSAPYGQFTLRDKARPIVFIATGTGIAPCRAYIRTHPDLDLTILHGVRESEDLFYRGEFEPFDYHPCLSRQPGTECSRRVTDLVGSMAFHPASHFYLCGGFEMILAVNELLRARGVPDEAIFTEEYYYRFRA